MGYARLRDFNSIVTNSLKDALVEMKAEGADEFVLDLRGNGGGAFQSALGVAGLFMDTKPITYIVRICSVVWLDFYFGFECGVGNGKVGAVLFCGTVGTRPGRRSCAYARFLFLH